MISDFPELETSVPAPTIPPIQSPSDRDGAGAENTLEDSPESSGETTRIDFAALAEDDSDDMPTVVLPMQLAALEDAARTDVGQQREHNEDYFGVTVQLNKSDRPAGRVVHARGLYILCDGMGGHAGGEVASQMAVASLQQYFQDYWRDEATGLVKLPPAAVIRQAVQAANEAIYTRNQEGARLGNGRMGTTLVMLLICDTMVAVAHVGDSRLYRFTRKGGLEQVTVDHEVGQREIQRGTLPELAYSRPDAYQLTQALGPRDENFVDPDVQFMELNEDTLFLLASDGLTDNQLLETYCPTHIDPLLSSQTNLEMGVKHLIDLANEHNGHDNITAMAVRAKVRPNLDSLY
jgi:protein phosphatase